MASGEPVKNVSNSTSNSIKSDQSPEAPFFDLFRRYYDAGRGRPAKLFRRYVGWTPQDFLDAMADAGGAPTSETLSHWLNRQTVPLPNAKNAFLKVFFPNADSGDARDNADRAELKDAWEAAWYKRRVAPRKRQEPESPDPASAWEHIGFEFEGLVEFGLEDPVPSNEGNDWLLLPAILRFGGAQRPWDGGLVTLALSKAYLAVRETGFRIVAGRLIGKNGPLPHDNFRRETGYAEVVNPKNGGGHLDNWVLPEPETIAVVRPAAEAGGSLTAEIVAWPVEFDVTAIRTGAGPPSLVESNKDAVLKALVLEITEKDSLGRVVLARRQVERKPLG